MDIKFFSMIACSSLLLVCKKVNNVEHFLIVNYVVLMLFEIYCYESSSSIIASSARYESLFLLSHNYAF